MSNPLNNEETWERKVTSVNLWAAVELSLTAKSLTSQRASSSRVDTVLTVRCSQDESLTEAPVPFNDWSPLAISEIAPNSELLKTNDVYWGSGSYEGEYTP